MKQKVLGLMVIALLMTQGLFAGSSIDGGDKHGKKEVNGPASRADIGEMPRESSMEAPAAAPVSTPSVSEKGTVAVVEHPEKATDHHKVIKQSREKVKPLKVLREARKHDDGSIFGILSLIFGILGFLLAWFLWPIGLLFAAAAISLGIIGLVGDKPKRGMSIAGLVLGILTIVIPILIIVLILAVFF